MNGLILIRYLLCNGFEFVLTRKFSSDDIESLFSSVRQMCGSNDQTNSLSVTHALEKTTKCKLVSSSKFSNVYREASEHLIWQFNPALNNIQDPPGK